MQTGGLPEELRVRLVSLEDTIQREQLIDFLRQRMFRQTLLCHADGAGRPRTAPQARGRPFRRGADRVLASTRRPAA